MKLPAVYLFKCVCFAYKNKYMFKDSIAYHSIKTRNNFYEYTKLKTALFEKGCLYQYLKLMYCPMTSELYTRQNLVLLVYIFLRIIIVNKNRTNYGLLV